jgi:hypothetical protein
MPPEQETTEALAIVAEAVAESEASQPTDNDVEIARIEAEKEITIAAIEADTRIAVEESYNEARVEVAEAETAQENDVWQSINLLQSMVQQQNEQIAMLLALQTPAIVVTDQSLSSLEEEQTEAIEEIAETLEETNLIPMSTSPETSSTMMEHTDESGDVENPMQAVARTIAAPVIKLV